MKVVVVENGIAPLHTWINADYGIQVEVNSGIKNGDQVILQPSVNLAGAIRYGLAPTTRHRTLGRSREFDKRFHPRKEVSRVNSRLTVSALDPEPVSEEAAGVSFRARPYMPSSVAATACRRARMSAVRFAPNAFSNCCCACTHPFIPARKRASPASVTRSSLLRRSR